MSIWNPDKKEYYLRLMIVDGYYTLCAVDSFGKLVDDGIILQVRNGVTYLNQKLHPAISTAVTDGLGFRLDEKTKTIQTCLEGSILKKHTP